MHQKRLFFILLILILIFTNTKNPVYGASQDNNEFLGPEYCQDCHPVQMSRWEDSSHSQAFEDPEFREQWENLGSPQDCLRCHTSGWREEDGTYEYEGVTCEECHGPGNTMEKDTSIELCATCHSGLFPTYEEWKKSGPSHLNATCNLCHDKHTTLLHAGSSTGTCSICHEFHYDAFAQTKHEKNKVECADCHMYTQSANFTTGTPADTGHSFSMTLEQLDCTTCHDRPLLKHNILGQKAFSCLSCHGEIHSLQLKLVNGTTYPQEDSVNLCAQCHNERYTDWKRGTHGKADDPEAKCTECHEPHNPIIAGISTLVPSQPRLPAGAPSLWISVIVILVFVLLIISVITLRWKTVE